MATRLSKEQKKLKDLIGESAYRALKTRNAMLHIWRNSSPHNWWVEGSRGSMLWHSDTESWSSPKPDLKLFEKVNEEGKVIEYFGADSGRPRHSYFKLIERNEK